MVIAAGYPEHGQAEEAAISLVSSIDADAEVVVLGPGRAPSRIETAGYSGFLVTGYDPSLIRLDDLEPVFNAWKLGAPLLMDDAAAALAGSFFASKALPLDRSPIDDLSASRAFLDGQVGDFHRAGTDSVYCGAAADDQQSLGALLRSSFQPS